MWDRNVALRYGTGMLHEGMTLKAHLKYFTAKEF